jgi:hypothetical protein
MIKYLQRTRSATAGNCLGTTIKHLRRTTSGAAGSGLGRCRGLLIRPFTTSAPHTPCFVYNSFAKKKNGTAEIRG